MEETDCRQSSENKETGVLWERHATAFGAVLRLLCLVSAPPMKVCNVDCARLHSLWRLQGGGSILSSPGVLSYSQACDNILQASASSSCNFLLALVSKFPSSELRSHIGLWLPSSPHLNLTISIKLYFQMKKAFMGTGELTYHIFLCFRTVCYST